MFAISDGSRTKVKNPFQWHNLPGEPASWAYAGKKGPLKGHLSLHYFIFLILKISESELKDFENVCSKENMVISDEFKRKVLEKDELKQILDIEVKVKWHCSPTHKNSRMQ